MYMDISSLFKAICNAIREKEGTSQPILHQEIPERIRALEGTVGKLINNISIQEIEMPEIKMAEPLELINTEDIIIMEDNI